MMIQQNYYDVIVINKIWQSDHVQQWELFPFVDFILIVGFDAHLKGSGILSILLETFKVQLDELLYTYYCGII